MKKFITICILQCVSFYLFADEVDIYPSPEGIVASDNFNVDVRLKGESKWQPVFVYQSVNKLNQDENASWAPFSFSGEIEIRITPLNQKCDSLIIRPKAFQIKPTLQDNRVYLSLTKPSKLCMEINGNSDRVLFIFADTLDHKPKEIEGSNLIYFKPGVHEIGDKYKLQSNTTYYIDGGAVLKGSLYGEGKLENVIIRGRGLINSGYQKWNHPIEGLQSNILFEDAKNVVIEGIICIEAGNFQIKVQSKEANSRITIKNIKLIAWNKNTDGIHVSDMDWKDSPVVGNAKGIKLFVDDCFIRANDDAILTCDGVAYSEIKNCIIWDAGYGATFCLSWGGHQNVDSSRVNNCYVIHKGGNNPVFRANHAGAGLIQNVIFSNIFIEGNINSLISLNIMDHRYDPDESHNSINNIQFKNITLEGKCGDNSINGYNRDYIISNISFHNLKIDGKIILNHEDMNLRMNEFVKNVKFSE
jgi:hypothetical protein